MSNYCLNLIKCENCNYYSEEYSNNKCAFCDDCNNFELKEKEEESEEELYNADPNCKHEIISASGGGIKCVKCNGWFCF